MPATSYQRFLDATGRRIQTLRKSRGLSQEQLAEKLGMDRVSVGYIEQGRRSPKLSTLFAISRVLDVKVHDLFEDVEAVLEREAALERGAVTEREAMAQRGHATGRGGVLRPRPMPLPRKSLPQRDLERGGGDGLSL